MNYYYVTGSSKGIGKAICEALLVTENNRVVGISRSKSIEHPNYTHRTVDLSNIDKVLEFSFDEHPQAKRIVLINNAGAIGEIGTVGNLKSEAMPMVFDLGLTAPAILCNKFIVCYQGVGSERIIINVSSGAGKNTIGSWASYCAVKAGLDMFTRVIAEEQKGRTGPIKVLAVAPGIVDTNMQEQIRSANPDDFDRLPDFVEYHNKGQLASADEVAAKYVHIIEQIDSFTEAVISVRDLT